MPKCKFIRKACLYNGYDYDDTGNYNTNGRLSNIRLWKMIIIKTGRFLPFAIQWREIGNYKLRTPCNLNTFGWTGFSITWNIYLSSKFLFITFSCLFFELLKPDFNFRSKVHLFSIEDSMLIVRVCFLPTRLKENGIRIHPISFVFRSFISFSNQSVIKKFSMVTHRWAPYRQGNIKIRHWKPHRMKASFRRLIPD